MSIEDAVKELSRLQVIDRDSVIGPFLPMDQAARGLLQGIVAAARCFPLSMLPVRRIGYLEGKDWDDSERWEPIARTQSDSIYLVPFWGRTTDGSLSSGHHPYALDSSVLTGAHEYAHVLEWTSPPGFAEAVTRGIADAAGRPSFLKGVLCAEVREEYEKRFGTYGVTSDIEMRAELLGYAVFPDSELRCIVDELGIALVRGAQRGATSFLQSE